MNEDYPPKKVGLGTKTFFPQCGDNDKGILFLSNFFFDSSCCQRDKPCSNGSPNSENFSSQKHVLHRKKEKKKSRKPNGSFPPWHSEVYLCLLCF
jgi:hypothetical protein